MEDAELARRSLLGFGEMLAALGRADGGRQAEVRRADALGGRVDSIADSPYFNAAVVPPGAAPPPDDPGLPGCLWTIGGAVPGRVEDGAYATPCMGLVLPDAALDGAADLDVQVPSLAAVGDMNERAYGDFGRFSPLLQKLSDDRVRVHGLRVDGGFASVAITLEIGDDVGIYFVATDAGHRGRGLASGLVRTLLARARDRGVRTATLQASPEGLPVWERVGFRRVATMRAYLRAGAGA